MTSQDLVFTRVLKAIETVKAGGMVIMVDDEDRENEGDLVFAASHVSPEKINFMTKEARGLICLSLDQHHIDRLKLPMMADSTKAGSQRSTAFTVSIEAREGVSTGISAADRSHTIKVAVDEKTTPDDIVVPGHIFPLKARPGGVLERAGHTEGSVDLARLAGFKPAAVICEIMNDDGTMARLSDLEAFSKKHGIPIVSIADLVAFRLFKESLIEEVEARQVETEGGTFEGRLFKSLVDGTIHFALIKASSTIFSPDDIVDVRVHRQRTLVDVFAAAKVGGHQRITYGYEMLKKSNAAVFVYLTSPEPQISLPREFEELGQRTGSPTTSQRPELDPAAHSQPMDSLMLGVGAQILRHLGVRKMRVHMSNPMPLRGLLGFDLDVVDTVEIPRD